MKRNIDWQWLHSFLAVARGGGLTGAKPFTSLSVPSLSRHIQLLEDAMSERLFDRGPRSFTLTEHGQLLFEKVQMMNMIAEKLDYDEAPIQKDIRISMGTWTARFVSRKIAQECHRFSNWRPLLLTSIARHDIARGEIDIGVRNKAPTNTRLHSQKHGTVRYAAFRAKGSSPSGFIGLERPVTPTAIWTEHHSDIIMRVGSAELGIPFLQAGIAKMVLPVFCSQIIDGIEINEIIEPLESPQYLVSHPVRNQERPLKEAIEVIAIYLDEIAKI